MKVFFIDESGDHNLKIIDPLYPLFILGGIIVEQDYAYGEMEERVNEFKLDLFGRTDLILHSADITRNKNGFEQMKEKEFRTRFYLKLNELMQTLDYKVVACVIKKEEHLIQYGSEALDPYLVSLEIIAERFCFEIASRPKAGLLVVEKRSQLLDAMLDLAWSNLRNRGTFFIKARTIRQSISDLVLKSKQENIAGLQIADLALTPIGRNILGKHQKEDFQIIESKLRKNIQGNYMGNGLIILPKTKKNQGPLRSS